MHVPRWYCCKNERCAAAISLAADVYTNLFFLNLPVILDITKREQTR